MSILSFAISVPTTFTRGEDFGETIKQNVINKISSFFDDKVYIIDERDVKLDEPSGPHIIVDYILYQRDNSESNLAFQIKFFFGTSYNEFLSGIKKTFSYLMEHVDYKKYGRSTGIRVEANKFYGGDLKNAFTLDKIKTDKYTTIIKQVIVEGKACEIAEIEAFDFDDFLNYLENL